jgi:transcriptional regulator with XRE-family HTH domain
LDIKKERKNRGWSQEKLAKLLGVSRGTIVNYENDGVIPETKRPMLNRIFGDKESDASSSIYLEKDGTKIPLRELAVFFVENQDVFMQNSVLRLAIDKMVAQKLNEKLQDIISKHDLDR